MNNLEEQADNAKARELFWKPQGMARRHQAHHSERSLRPRALGDICLHDARFGGSHPCRPLSIIARLLSAAAKNSAWTFTATTRARAQLTQVQLRRTTGW
jgi:hypothetical protein